MTTSIFDGWHRQTKCKGRSPNLLISWMASGYSRHSNSTTSKVGPNWQVIWSGVLPSLSFSCSASGFCSTRKLITVGDEVARQATCNGIHPLSSDRRTESGYFLHTISITSIVCRTWQVIWSGVFRGCSQISTGIHVETAKTTARIFVWPWVEDSWWVLKENDWDHSISVPGFISPKGW